MHFSAELSKISTPTQKFETLRHQTHGAEMSWVRSVRTPYVHHICGPMLYYKTLMWSNVCWSEMTYIVSGGALNSTHSLNPDVVRCVNKID